MDPTPHYSTEERIMAAISHASILMPYVGAIVPLGVWVNQREKSEWVRFQSLQALVYQTSLFITLTLAGCLVIPFLFGSIAITTQYPEAGVSLMVGSFFLPYLIFGLVILTGLVAGVLCILGKDVMLPFLGIRIRRYLDEHSPGEEQEEDHD